MGHEHSSIGARRPEIVLVEKKFSIIDIAVPADVRCSEKKIDKVDKYQDMKREIGRIWQMRSVNVVPVMIGALGSVTRKFEKWLENKEVTYRPLVICYGPPNCVDGIRQ